MGRGVLKVTVSERMLRKCGEEGSRQKVMNYLHERGIRLTAKVSVERDVYTMSDIYSQYTDESCLALRRHHHNYVPVLWEPLAVRQERKRKEILFRNFKEKDCGRQ